MASRKAVTPERDQGAGATITCRHGPDPIGSLLGGFSQRSGGWHRPPGVGRGMNAVPLLDGFVPARTPWTAASRSPQTSAPGESSDIKTAFGLDFWGGAAQSDGDLSPNWRLPKEVGLTFQGSRSTPTFIQRTSAPGRGNHSSDRRCSRCERGGNSSSYCPQLKLSVRLRRIPDRSPDVGGFRIPSA